MLGEIGMKSLFDRLDDALREAFEERAAIREFDGQQTRDEAEHAALAEIRAKVDSDKAEVN
jgi:hypothetical protein